MERTTIRQILGLDEARQEGTGPVMLTLKAHPMEIVGVKGDSLLDKYQKGWVWELRNVRADSTDDPTATLVRLDSLPEDIQDQLKGLWEKEDRVTKKMLMTFSVENRPFACMLFKPNAHWKLTP